MTTTSEIASLCARKSVMKNILVVGTLKEGMHHRPICIKRPEIELGSGSELSYTSLNPKTVMVWLGILTPSQHFKNLTSGFKFLLTLILV